VRAFDANIRELQRRGGAIDRDVTIQLAELMYAAARALRDQVSDYRAAAGVAARAAKLFKISLGNMNLAYAKLSTTSLQFFLIWSTSGWRVHLTRKLFALKELYLLRILTYPGLFTI
jgi:hypothetical protein